MTATVLLTPAKLTLTTRSSDKNVRNTPKAASGNVPKLNRSKTAPQSAKKNPKSTSNALSSAFETLSIKTPVKQGQPTTSKNSSSNSTPLKQSSNSKKESAVLRAARLLDARRRVSVSRSPSALNSPRRQSLASKSPILKQTSPKRTSFISGSPLPASRKAYDRFVPERHTTTLATSHLRFTASSLSSTSGSNTTDLSKYQYDVAKACGVSLESRLLSFGNNTKEKNDQAWLKQYAVAQKKMTTRRKIGTVPERVLDAPGLLDDYYLNVLDWSMTNLLAIGLGNAVYLWNATTGHVQDLNVFDEENIQEDDYVSSLSWCADGSHLSVSEGNGRVGLFDVETRQRVRGLQTQCSTRAASAHWSGPLVTTGHFSGMVHTHDVRVAQSLVKRWSGHGGEVCGLKWSPDGTNLATGANDDSVRIWDIRRGQRDAYQGHVGAVKALSWCPWQSNTLISGGGLDDRSICIWNTQSNELVNRIKTNSQVTSLHWSKTYREFVSSHGFSENALKVWKYSTLSDVVSIQEAHTSRVLMTTLSPDGQVLCSAAAGDESLKFWKVFEAPNTKKKISGADNTKELKNGKMVSPDFGTSEACR